MTTLLEPFAPLWPWLKDAVGFHALMTPHGYAPARECEARPDLMRAIDLRDFPTRAVVLHALAGLKHLHPWALGEGFGSDLTAEQAGRVVAEMVRCVGANPETARPLPLGILGVWTLHESGSCWDRRWHTPKDRKHKSYDYYTRSYAARFGSKGECGDWYIQLGNCRAHGPEIGAAGRLAADLATPSTALFWEQVTP